MKINKVLFSAAVLASLFSCADNELMTVMVEWIIMAYKGSL